jgi:hypothetical protein
MAEEGFDNNKETSDPDEDYGLPKIEIKPIQKAESKQEQKPVVAPVESGLEAGAKTAYHDQKQAGRPAKDTVTEEPGKSYAWLVMILVLLGILVGGWFYYNYSSNGVQEAAKKEAVVQEQVPEPAPPAQEIIEAPVEEVETFSLTEIKSRIDRPRYFLVVASFIDEDLAKDRAEELQAKQMNTFLVYPYGDIAYYRLAIGQYESFALAAEQIDKEKDKFKENLWVLKY